MGGGAGRLPSTTTHARGCKRASGIPARSPPARDDIVHRSGRIDHRDRVTGGAEGRRSKSCATRRSDVIRSVEWIRQPDEVVDRAGDPPCTMAHARCRSARTSRRAGLRGTSSLERCDILHRSGESTTVANMAGRANAPHTARCLTADASPMRAPHARAMGSLVRAYLDTLQADRFCPPGRVGAWQDAPHEVR